MLRFGLALVIASVLSIGCNRKSTPHETVLGDVTPVGLVDLSAYLAMARAIVTHDRRPSEPLPPLPGRRAFITAWSPSHALLTGTGIGDTLIASVEAAAEALGDQVPPDARLQLDVLSGAEPFLIAEETNESLGEIGCHGYVVGADREHVGFVLPTEILAFRYFDIRAIGLPRLVKTRLSHTLAIRAGVVASALEQMPAYRVTTISSIESVQPGRVDPLFRSMPPRPQSLSADELIEAVRGGADYLAGALDEVGRFRYFYRPVEDTRSDAYGLLRHAGSAYALLEAYGETRNPRYLAKAEQALAFQETLYQETADGSFFSDNPAEEQQKVGGNGLALVALAKHAELTGQRNNLPRMRRLARFIAHQQYPDGHFRANADVEREDPSAREKQLAREVFYFPGEATLGLMRLYGIDRQPQWLEVAKKAANYLLSERDGHDDEDHQIHDHWLSYALLDLYRETKVQAYADHAFKIARAILRGELAGANLPAPDFAGSFYAQGETTPASTRLEAIAADVELSRFMGLPHDWLDGPAMQMAAFIRAQQYDANNAFFLKTPNKAIGGVRESLFVTDIRIDYVQHAMCAWLHLARVLRDPNYGRAR